MKTIIWINEVSKKSDTHTTKEAEILKVLSDKIIFSFKTSDELIAMEKMLKNKIKLYFMMIEYQESYIKINSHRDSILKCLNELNSKGIILLNQKIEPINS